MQQDKHARRQGVRLCYLKKDSKFQNALFKCLFKCLLKVLLPNSACALCLLVHVIKRYKALWVMSYGLCVMRSGLCVMHNALCVMRSGLCVMHNALCVMRYALWVVGSGLCVMRVQAKVYSSTQGEQGVCASVCCRLRFFWLAWLSVHQGSTSLEDYASTKPPYQHWNRPGRATLNIIFGSKVKALQVLLLFCGSVFCCLLLFSSKLVALYGSS